MDPRSPLHWEFSDGGTADGATPHHTFADDGTYSGTLTVTDDNGGTKTKTFSITVANVAPSVDAGAGADAITDWGRPVSFAGQATDPSSVDQSSLEYTWDFGDGSPAATGADASHIYTTPSASGYDATLTVCDKDGGCGSDVRHVSVTKRDTTTTYTGDAGTTPGTAATLRASLVDEYGQPLTGALDRVPGGDGWSVRRGDELERDRDELVHPHAGPGLVQRLVDVRRRRLVQLVVGVEHVQGRGAVVGALLRRLPRSSEPDRRSARHCSSTAPATRCPAGR